MHLWLNDNYKGNVEKVTKAVKQFIELECLRNDNINIPFIATSVARDVFQIAKTCHVESEIGVCCGDAGLGKTYAVNEIYIKESSTREKNNYFFNKIKLSDSFRYINIERIKRLYSFIKAIVIQKI